MPQFLTIDQAANLIKDNDTVLLCGSGGGLLDAEHLYIGIEKRFLENKGPYNLTLVHVTGVGSGNGTGVAHFAHKGMVKRVIGGHWGWSPEMGKLALDEEIEAYNLPQGVISLLAREIAAKRSGLLTTIGMHTFVDPNLEGGKLNKKSKDDIVQRVTLAGKEQLFFPTFPINVTLIRGTSADEAGNISVEREAVDLDILAASQAAHNSGGLVIAQVKRKAKANTLHPRMVKVPACMVDAIVVVPEQWQTCESEYEPSFSGELKIPMDNIKPLNFDVRKIVARRAALELAPDTVVNLGFGISDGVANIAAEEGLSQKITFSVEQGIVGGVPAKGAIFGAGYNPDMIVDAPALFDFYHGGGLDMTFLGMAQADQDGNINVSKFGKNIAGCGGFIDISQNAKQVVFCATFTAGGLKVEIVDGKLNILQEGKVKKFIPQVEQITFSGKYALEKDQRVLYVTERAVFERVASGLRLIEIAPGIDLEKDILAQMEFTPEIASPLKTMPQEIFYPQRMNEMKPDIFKGF